jgi:hypothetical protein
MPRLIGITSAGCECKAVILVSTRISYRCRPIEKMKQGLPVRCLESTEGAFASTTSFLSIVQHDTSASVRERAAKKLCENRTSEDICGHLDVAIFLH